MKFNNSKVRRQDRLMDEPSAYTLLKDGEFGILSMVDAASGGGYGVPLNYVWDGNDSIYIHCAPDGEKLNNLRANPEVTFCIVGKRRLIPEMFTTEYESIMLKGTAHCDLPAEERMRALHAVVEKFSPEHLPLGYKYSEKSFHRVEVIRVDIREWSAKCKHVKGH